MAAHARGVLRRRILRDARGLAPSVELPWMPPWGDELESTLVDLLAGVRVLHADVSDARTWDDDGARRRAAIVDDCAALADRADSLQLRATAHALREISASVRAWEALAPTR